MKKPVKDTDIWTLRNASNSPFLFILPVKVQSIWVGSFFLWGTVNYGHTRNGRAFRKHHSIPCETKTGESSVCYENKKHTVYMVAN